MAIAPPEGKPVEKSIRAELVGRRLPKRALPGLAGAALIVAILMALIGLIQGVALTLLWAVIIFVVVQSVWSFRVEGRRHAVDRLMTTAVYAAFVIALIPLVAILFTVISKGISVINAEFFSCLLYTSPSPRDRTRSRMPSSA